MVQKIEFNTKIMEENLEMESKDITIVRSHITCSKTNGKKRDIIVKFLNY